MSVYDLNGKVALVTGAARGIGFETARHIHERGGSVAVLDLDAGQAREAAERIGERTLGIGADVTDCGAMMAAVAETVERFGGLDIAVANAGIAPEGATTRTMPPEEWERVIDVDLMGVWQTVRAALPQISERQGQLVLVASVAAFANGTMLSPYAVAKAGVEQLGRALRTELAPFGASATVAYFGWIDTEMVREALDRQAGGQRIQELFPKWFFKRLTPDVAGGAIADGIEERAPRVFAPRWWARVSALRGLVNPLLDRRAERDARIGEAIRSSEEERGAKAGAPGAAPVTPYDLSGKVALVTGAARGIGFATASQLHMRGASVAVVDLDPDQAREAADRIGERAIGIGADVTDAGAMMATVAETVERLGEIDVVVANAGIAPPTVTTTRAMPPEEWERVVDVDLMGVWHTVRATLPMVSERGGQVVLIGSILSYANGYLGSPYAVAKAGVEQLGRALRVELAPFGASATVAYFGWVDTELVRDTLDRQGVEKWLLETNPKFMLRRITPDEAGAALARGIEQRAPRVFAPRFPWRYFSALRGLVNPLLDRRADSDPKVAKVVREAEAASSAKHQPAATK
jgi:NAD(P)-dependent dehydrogenase (short-subunit alcohol dehydrogenase family)